MVALSVAAFLVNPMAFPFVLVTAFLIWATPFAIAAFLQRDDDSGAEKIAPSVAAKPPSGTPPAPPIAMEPGSDEHRHAAR